MFLVERELVVNPNEFEDQFLLIEWYIAPFVTVDIKQPGVLLGEQVEPAIAGLIGERFVVNHVVERETLVEWQVCIIPGLDKRQHNAIGVKLQVLEMGIADQESHPRELFDRSLELETDFPAPVVDSYDRLNLAVDYPGLEKRNKTVARIGQDETIPLVEW